MQFPLMIPPKSKQILFDFGLSGKTITARNEALIVKVNF